jgi:alpha-beta hydrolase superfamily lysophospholipase
VAHTEGRFTGAGGVELYRQAWQPASAPNAAVVLVHGVGEHSGRYANVVDRLVGDGNAVYAYDQRGHGRSPGARVYIGSWDEYRTDLGTFIDLVKAEVDGAPVFVYGHSMGTLVVLEYLTQGSDGLAGMIISGVAIEPAGVGKPYQVVMARVLSRVTPKLSMDLGISAESLTRDPQALEAYLADPLVTSRATVRWGAESLGALDRVKQGMGSIDLPLLAVHGGADPLNRPEGAQELIDAVPNADKTLHVYPDVRHEPHNDLGHEQVAADISEWVRQRAD